MASKKKSVVNIIDMRNAFYQAADPRRRLERLDSKLAGNDTRAFANCYPEAYQTYFPGSLGDKKMREEY